MEAKTYQCGSVGYAIFGVRPVRPIINIPLTARRVRLRLRNNNYGRAFIKYDDRIEHWILFSADGTRAGAEKEWRIDLLQGVNKIQKGSVWEHH